MADHRIDDLRLRLRTHSGQTQGPAERFVSAILEAAGDLLESRYPGRLVFLPHLKLRWRITEAELADASAVSRYAQEIAASFGEPTTRRPGEPMPENDLAVFSDETTWWACYLAAVAAGNGQAGAWVYETLHTSGVRLGSLAARGIEFALAVLSELSRSGMLLRVVRPADEEAVTRVNELFAATAASSPVDRDKVATLLQFAESVPHELSRSKVWLLVYIEAHQTYPAAQPQELAGLTVSVIRECTRGSSEEGPAATPGTQATRVTPVTTATRLTPASPAMPATTDEAETQFGGLFYLLSLVLELDLAEMLWKACLPEGAVLARIAETIIGPVRDHDPAALLFGGVRSSQTIEVLQEQQEEIAGALLASVAAALPRRSLGRLPELMLRLLPFEGYSMLVASEPGSPYVLFSWPVQDARKVERGVQVFLSAWPPSAPRVLATPSIAGLEGGVRLRAVPEIEGRPGLLIGDMDSPSASALIAQAAGALCHLFAARAGLEARADVVSPYFGSPAKVTIHPQEMIVKLQNVEIALRRSGLDRDPGWVPWIGRVVRFAFGSDD